MHVRLSETNYSEIILRRGRVSLRSTLYIIVTLTISIKDDLHIDLLLPKFSYYFSFCLELHLSPFFFL